MLNDNDKTIRQLVAEELIGSSFTCMTCWHNFCSNFELFSHHFGYQIFCPNCACQTRLLKDA